MTNKRANRAFTLLELIIAIAVLTIAGTGIWYFVQQSNRSWETIADDSTMMSSLRRAQQDIHLHLIQCNPDPTHLIFTPGTNWDTVEFKIPIGLTAGSAVWGADGNANWKYSFEVKTVDGSDDLYRITYDDSNVERSRVLVLRGIADQAGGSKGLQFTYAGGNVTTTLGMKRKITAQSGMLERSLTFNTLLRN